jgi:hypothetical protein
MFLRAVLPERHVSADSKDTVRLGMGLVATMVDDSFRERHLPTAICGRFADVQHLGSGILRFLPYPEASPRKDCAPGGQDK